MNESSLTRTGQVKAPIILFACVGCAILLLVVFAHNDAKKSEQLQAEHMPGTGRPLTALNLEPLVGDAQPIELKDILGQVVLINYWGTWCGPCRIEMPHLIDLHERWRHEARFRMISVSCGPDETAENASELRSETADFLKEYGYQLVVYSDPKGMSRRALVKTAQLQNRGFSYPTTVMLDRKGTVRYIWPGYAPGFEQEMHQAIEKLIAEG